MTTPIRCTILAAAALAFAGAASAGPISLSNTRPVTANVIASEPALQSLVDSILGPGTDVKSDQSAATAWGAETLSLGILATLAFEYSYYQNINSFGLWSGEDTDALTHVPIFKSAANGIGSGVGTSATQAAINWDESGAMTIRGDCLKVNCGTYGAIDPLRFGFYLQVGSDNNRFYTADQLNPGGLARTFAFQQAGTASWAIGFEDFTDGDGNDGVLGIQGLTPAPVPEPATILLMATGAAGFLIRRRRASKSSASLNR